jgi:hypothetical protein
VTALLVEDQERKGNDRTARARPLFFRSFSFLGRISCLWGEGWKSKILVMVFYFAFPFAASTRHGVTATKPRGTAGERKGKRERQQGNTGACFVFFFSSPRSFGTAGGPVVRFT